MHETHGCSPACKTWGAIRVCGPWEVRTLLRCNCHMHSPGSLCVLANLAQYNMNVYVYPTGFVRCPFGCNAGPCRRRTGFGTPYGQSCRTVYGKYRACRTHKYGRLSDLIRMTLYGPKIIGSPSWKAVHALHSATGYTVPYGSKNPWKIVQTRSAVIHPI